MLAHARHNDCLDVVVWFSLEKMLLRLMLIMCTNNHSWLLIRAHYPLRALFKLAIDMEEGPELHLLKPVSMAISVPVSYESH